MRRVMQITAILEREGDGYVALCPELDVASEGDTLLSIIRQSGLPRTLFEGD